MSDLMQTLPEGFKQAEIGIIPEVWDVCLIDDVVSSLSSGGTPFRGNPSFYKGVNRWITSGELKYGVINDTIEKISDDAIKKSHLKVHPEGTFLMAITGLEAAGTRGSCGIVGKPATTNQSCMAIYPNKKLTSKFLFHWYVYNGEELALTYCQGTKQLSYTAGLLKTLPILLPRDIAEQTAIANALSDVDALLTELENLIAKKQAIKTATMQQLLTGKTRLPQFAYKEGATYTEGAVEGKRKGKKSSELGEIPEDWDVISVKEVTSDHKQGFYTKDSYTNDGIRLARITDINNPFVDFDSMPRLKITDSDYKQYKVRVGDVLIARSGAIGRYGIITKPIKAVFASYIIRFSFNQSKMINNYFGYVYQSDETQEQLLSITQGSSNININAGNIKSLKIKLPSVEEQTVIATILSDMDNEIQNLEQRLTKTRQIKQGMMQQLLTGRTRLPFSSTSEGDFEGIQEIANAN